MVERSEEEDGVDWEEGMEAIAGDVGLCYGDGEKPGPKEAWNVRRGVTSEDDRWGTNRAEVRGSAREAQVPRAWAPRGRVARERRKPVDKEQDGEEGVRSW